MIYCLAMAYKKMVVEYERNKIPDHLLNHTVIFQEDLIDPQTGKELNKLIRKMGSDKEGFQSTVAKSGVSNLLHEHIGDAQPILENGQCEHMVQVADSKGENCIFAQRVDVGRHFVMTGGPDAVREPYEQMVSRVSSFARYMFNVKEYPVVDKLFSSDKFQEAAKSVCPADKQYLDPFQFNFIL